MNKMDILKRIDSKLESRANRCYEVSVKVENQSMLTIYSKIVNDYSLAEEVYADLVEAYPKDIYFKNITPVTIFNKISP